MPPPTRRRILQTLGATALLGTGGLAPRFARRAGAGPDERRFLIVMGCFGGASMIDCFMPVDEALAATHPDRGRVIGYPVVRPEGLAIASVDRDVPRRFLLDHGEDMVVLGTQASSVNHFTAQRRAVDGRGVMNGRTLAEAVAAVHGADLPLPNVNMGRGGFLEPGTDPTLDPRYRPEVVTNPVTFALSTHGHAGLVRNGDRLFETPEGRAALVARARALRDDTLEGLSGFGQTFAASRVRQDLLWKRRVTEPALEAADLVEKLLYVPDLGEVFPIEAYGLEANPEWRLIEDTFPGAWPETTSGTPGDRLEAQAALAYLLVRHQVAAAVTLTSPGTDGFLAFDQSHTDHLEAQQVHWDRALDVVSRLVGLLRQVEYVDAAGPTGTPIWDRCMVVFATEFGRDKWDTGEGFGTGHHMNNGLLVVSPLLRGNLSLGEPDPGNGHICGFDPETGEPTPFDDLGPGEDPAFDDPRLPPGEEAVFGTLLAALGISFDGQEVMPVLLPD